MDKRQRGRQRSHNEQGRIETMGKVDKGEWERKIRDNGEGRDDNCRERQRTFEDVIPNLKKMHI